MKFSMICLSAAFVALAAGCSAEFTDLRPEDETAPNVATNATTPSNATTGNSDAGATDSDAGMTGDDAGPEPDVGVGAETLVATGDFVNVDYQTEGSAQFWQLADGTYEVRLTADFSVSGVPGPAIALSPRNPLGGAIEADELDLGALDSNSGTQSYALPGSPNDYAYVWIWCKPFGLDVAFASMEFQ